MWEGFSERSSPPCVLTHILIPHQGLRYKWGGCVVDVGTGAMLCLSVTCPYQGFLTQLALIAGLIGGLIAGRATSFFSRDVKETSFRVFSPRIAIPGWRCGGQPADTARQKHHCHLVSGPRRRRRRRHLIVMAVVSAAPMPRSTVCVTDVAVIGCSGV